MAWDLAANFLNKFKNIKPPRDFVQGSVAEIIEQITGVVLKSGNLDIRNGVIYIKLNHPMIKNQILMGKEKILEEVSKKVGHRAPRDIMFSGE